MQKLVKNIISLTGDSTSHGLESRIFNTICVISLAFISINVPFNYVIGLPKLALLMSVLGIIISVLYYLSRFRNKLSLSVTSFVILGNILCIVNFFYNSGIDGPTIILFILSFFLSIAIVPKSQTWFWVSLNIIIVFSLLVIDFKNPAFTPNTYPTLKDRYLDLGYTYIAISFIIFVTTTFIRNGYHKEKKIVEQKAIELQEANDTKNKLFSILAHDLRAPLNSIQNFLEVLSKFDLEEDERLNFQNQLLTETKNTQQMLSNLLSWSKSQMNGVSVNLTNLNVRESLQLTLNLIKTAALEKCIEFEDRLDDAACVIADSDMLQLVIRNLANNAIKFTLPGGKITISTQTKRDQCLIVVQDNGRGISPDAQDLIFSLKAKSTYGTNNERGVGLGLVLCKDFIEMQNGKIWFQSGEGKGSSFFISLQQCSPTHFNGTPGFKKEMVNDIEMK